LRLDRVKYIDEIRSVWSNEARDFTPWLAENIAILGVEVGLELELVNIEHEVGSFSLDILAKDINSGYSVIIENQLENTDHTHLGQLITYASGVDAKIIIWVSRNIREEHQKALEWLNEISNEEISFFGVEIQIIRIGESLPAPLFKVKVSPNEWYKKQSKKVREFNSSKADYYEQFFTKVLDHIHKEVGTLTKKKKATRRSALDLVQVNGGFTYLLLFTAGNRFGCEIYIDFGDRETNKEKFDELYSNKEEIEEKLGELIWDRKDEARHSRIGDYIHVTEDEEMIGWAVRLYKEFREVFSRYIK